MLNNKILYPLIFRLTDIAIIAFCAYLAFHYRFDYKVEENQYIYISIIGILFFQIIATYSKIYSSWRGHYGFSLAKRLISTWILSGISILALLTIIKKGEDISRLWLIYWQIGSIAFLLAGKLLAYGLAAQFRQKGINSNKIFVISTSNKSKDLEQHLNNTKWSGYDIKDTCDPDQILNDPKTHIRIDSSIQEIWVALPISEGKKIQSILYHLRNNTQNIRLIPSISDLRLLNHKVTQVAGLQIIDLSVSPLDEGGNAIIKRSFDISFSLIALLLIWPILLAISFIVKATSPGPAVFKQIRNGIHGKEISVYKFRSMHVHNEKNKVTQARKNDSRITPVGSFLRKSSLDELPQFINVLQGKMSVVGPRPHAISHNEEYKEIVDSYMRRHKVKPGITGWAQINGYRGETDTIDKMEKRVEFDLYYIDNWSIWFDIKIVIMTIFKGFFDKNAY